MQITIRNFCGVEAADLSASPIALLAGLNGAGKSSTLAAVAAALTGQLLPAAIAKKDAGSVVRDGADLGRVSVSEGDGTTTVDWPACQRLTAGTAPRASAIAAGIESILDMDIKARAQVLAKYLKTDPTMTELAAALRDSDARFVTDGTAQRGEPELMQPLGLDPKDQRHVAIYRMVSRIWGEIEVSGFDGGHKSACDEGAQLKGAWRHVAGEAYGVQKAENWRHKDAFLADEIVPHGKEPLSFLEAEVVERKKAEEATIRAAAVDAAHIEDLRVLAAGLPELETALAEAQKASRLASQAELDAINAIPVDLYDPLTCPHCGCGVEIGSDGKLMQATHSHTADAIAANRQAIADARAAAEAASRHFGEAKQAVLSAQKLVDEARDAARKLEGIGAEKPCTEQDVAEAKALREKAEKALAALKATAEAGRIHRQIIGNQALIDALAPDGVRKTKLSRVLEAFNEAKLAPLCAAAGWPAVAVDPFLDVRFGGRLAREPFISESQVMRARIVLQVAMAQLDGSACVLIDRADKLDQAGRNGLFKLLKSAEIKAVVAMTMNKPELMPDLARAGLGESYWLSGNVARSRGEALAPVQQAAE